MRRQEIKSASVRIRVHPSIVTCPRCARLRCGSNRFCQESGRTPDFQHANVQWMKVIHFTLYGALLVKQKLAQKKIRQGHLPWMRHCFFSSNKRTRRMRSRCKLGVSAGLFAAITADLCTPVSSLSPDHRQDQKYTEYAAWKFSSLSPGSLIFHDVLEIRTKMQRLSFTVLPEE